MSGGGGQGREAHAVVGLVDRAAFGELVRVYSPRLLRLANGILGDPDAAEEAVQEALLHAWKGLSGFRGDAALSTWVHTITVRTCQRELKRRMVRESWTVARRAELDWADPDYSVDPVAVLSRSTDHDCLTVALAKLPAVYRIAVLLHDVEGLSAAKVAVVMRTPLGTAKARIARGRAVLVTVLAELDATPQSDAKRGLA